MSRTERQRAGWPANDGYTLFELLVVLVLLGVVFGLGWVALRKSLIKARLRHAARMLKIELTRARLKAIRTGKPYKFQYQPGGTVFEIVPLFAYLEGEAEAAAGQADGEATNSLLEEDRLSTGQGLLASQPSGGWDGGPSAVGEGAVGEGTTNEVGGGATTPSDACLCQCQERWLPEGVRFADPAAERFVEESSLSEEVARAASGEPVVTSESMGPVRLDRPPWVIDWRRPPPTQPLVESEATAALTETTATTDAGSLSAETASRLAADLPPEASSASASLEQQQWLTPLVFQPDGRAENVKLTLLGPRGYRVDLFVRGLTGEIWVGPVYRQVNELLEQTGEQAETGQQFNDQFNETNEQLETAPLSTP